MRSLRPVSLLRRQPGFRRVLRVFSVLVPRADDVHQGGGTTSSTSSTRTCLLPRPSPVSLFSFIFVWAIRLTWFFLQDSPSASSWVGCGRGTGCGTRPRRVRARVHGRRVLFPGDDQVRVVPVALVTMLSYQIAAEAREAYGGYPRWATNSFGGGCAWRRRWFGVRGRGEAARRGAEVLRRRYPRRGIRQSVVFLFFGVFDDGAREEDDAGHRRGSNPRAREVEMGPSPGI